jgi:hypothetical protein
VDPNNSEFLYIQDISNEYRALAFIYEQNILRVALETALQQIQGQSHGSAQNQQAMNNNAFFAGNNIGNFGNNPAFGATNGFANANTQQAPFMMQQ